MPDCVTMCSHYNMSLALIYVMNAGGDLQSCPSVTENKLGTAALSLASVLGLITIALCITTTVAVYLGYRCFKGFKKSARYIANNTIGAYHDYSFLETVYRSIYSIICYHINETHAVYLCFTVLQMFKFQFMKW